ncbi:MAG: Gfo/Idh/MocA family oxidoreductase [Tannerella sp.]|jgi:predicted dehydrogenase|nr:Gfo/Idh/MocA family oxidoreductase [Tannerella sp.]
MKKLRVAVIGFGFMGKTHAKRIIESKLMELSAIVDNQAGMLHQVSGNIDTGGIPEEILARVKKYSQLDDCLQHESLDLVFVCVHTLSHYDAAMKSLQHGLHVFIEKPFILDVREGESLLAEARKRNLRLSVGHVVRFMPAYAKLYDLYKSGVYGKLNFISMTRFSGAPDWGEWKKRRNEFGSSGGALFDLVIHDIDFLQYMLGIPDTIDSKCIPGVLSNHDYVSAFWRYTDNDINVKVEGGLTFHSRFPFDAGFKASFDKASVFWSSANGREMIVADDTTVEVMPLADANDGYTIEDELFAKSIVNKEELFCPAESALDTIRLCYRHIR